MVDTTLMKAFTKIGHISFLVLILSSCGRDYENSSFEGVRVGQNLNVEQRRLDPFERNIALRICESYRAKWVEFRLNKLNQNFNYTYTANLCDASLNELKPLQTKLIRLTSKEDSPLTFDSSSFVNYVQYMQTHMHGDLSRICTPLMTRGETPPVSFELENEIVQYSFKENGNQDSYTVYRVKQRVVEGEGIRNEVVGQDTFQVLTRPESSRSSLRGLVTNSQRVQSCSEESKEVKATFTQEYNY